MQSCWHMYVCVCAYVTLSLVNTKSRMHGPMKFKLGVCVPHDEYMNPIVFGADPVFFWLKT